MQLALEAAGFTTMLLPDVKDPSSAFRKVRNDAFTWQQVSDLATSNHHAWCSFYRDNWSCVGARYRKVLRNTVPYNTSLTFASFPRNTTIYAEGNSYFGEIVMTTMCNTDANFWKLDGLWTNSMVAHVRSKNILVVLLDNDDLWVKHPAKVARAFKVLRRQPDLIALGTINFDNRSIESRTSDYKLRFPGARIVDYSGIHRLPRNCRADFKNCVPHAGHQCLPGPTARSSEQLILRLLSPARGAGWRYD